MCLATPTVRPTMMTALVRTTAAATPQELLMTGDSPVLKNNRRLMLKRSLDSSLTSHTDSTKSVDSDTTTSTSSSSSSSEEEEEQEIRLVTRPSRSASRTGVKLNYAQELNAARDDPSQTTLVLTDFVERSTRHDVYALRDLLLQDDREWNLLQLNDTCCATNFRRWAYKKDNVSHHIQKLCLNKGIPLEYHASIELNVDDLSCDSVVAMLQEVKKHPEVRRLHIVGHLNSSQQKLVLQTLTSLLRLEDRDWNAVNVQTGYASTASADTEEGNYETWRQTMEHYMGQVFSQLYTQYNIPIDIRPMCG